MASNKQTFFKKIQVNQSKGFTLIEILIAILLLLGLMTGVYTITVDSINTKERVVSEDQSFMEVETAIHRLEVDFAQLYSPLYYSLTEKESEVIKGQMGVPASTNENSDDSGNIQAPATNDNFPLLNARGELVPEVFNPDKGVLIFFTTSNRRYIQDTKEARYNWVKYSVKENPKASNKEAPFELIRQTQAKTPYAEDLDWDNQKQMILLNNIKEFSFLFWDERTKKYVDSLRLLNENHYVLRAIKVRLTWIDQSQGEFTFERIMRAPWPFFNRKKDEAERWSEFKNNQSGGSNPPSPTATPE